MMFIFTKIATLKYGDCIILGSSDVMHCCLTSCVSLIRLLHLCLLLGALTMHAQTIFLSVPIELSNPCSEHSSCCRSKLGSLQGLKVSRESSNQHTFCILFEGLATASKHKEWRRDHTDRDITHTTGWLDWTIPEGEEEEVELLHLQQKGGM